MLTLRCTKEFLGRLDVTPSAEPPESTTLLGDWFANVVTVHRQPLALFVSARTLLPLVVPLGPSATLLSRFAASLGQLLWRLRIDPEAIEREVAALQPVTFGTTNSPQVLRVMVEFAFMLETYADPGRSLVDVSAQLSESPSSALGERMPAEVARAALGGGGVQ